MANTPSAVRRIHKAARLRESNRQQRSEVRSAIKRFRSLIESGETAAARESLPATLSLIDSTAGKGVLHRNTAARTKSRLVAALRRAEG